MKSLLRLICLALAAAFVSVSAFAAKLDASVEPGSAAPAMSVKKWFKGTPVTAFAPDKTYVVEFWATWCGPCIQSIPHLTEVAKANPDVTFVGVSIWEDDTDKIPDFVKNEGDKMDYNVGYSGNQDGMAQTWMAAAGQNGIPTAFIIKNGSIVWVGHPMSIEKPLAEVKAGTFDLKAFKAKFDEGVARNKKFMASMAEIRTIEKLYDDGRHHKAKAELAAQSAKDKTVADEADGIRFGWLAKENPTAWTAKATSMANSGVAKQRQMVLSFALRQADKGGNQAQGQQAIDLVLKATKNNDFLALEYANAYYERTQKYTEDLQTVNRMLEILPTTDQKDNADLKASLEKDRTELQAKTNGGK